MPTMASRAQLRAAANERARIALAIMQREGLGIEAAAARVKTTRRNVRRFMQDMGITTRRSRRRGDRGKLLITRQPLQKVRDFIDDMNQGLSATAATKRSHTTVRTMSKIMVKGEPLLVKVNNRWQLNVLIKHIYSLVYYGYLTGLGGKVQGGGEDHPEEHQYGEEDDEGLIESRRSFNLVANRFRLLYIYLARRISRSILETCDYAMATRRIRNA